MALAPIHCSGARPAPAAAWRPPSEAHGGPSAVFWWDVVWRWALPIAPNHGVGKGALRACQPFILRTSPESRAQRYTWCRRHSPLPSLLRACKMRRQKIRQRLDTRGARATGRRQQMHRALGLFPVLEDHFDLARGDRVADDEIRQIGDPKPREQRRHQRLAIVDAQRAAGPDARLLAGGIGVAPDPRRGEIGIA